ncbi:Hint domain-containing protein [Oceanicola sp. 22II-s10i]|uniref:Hint domain-containing protein n=1 Tax=Oceanicola sp. 22II-s10i TaxID=1317116 RepID=UPI000B526FB0|nr:Hint domain-containing protein [Oceanicola sp. 22II-s10i]
MATTNLYGFSISSFIIDGGGSSVSVGSFVTLDPDWDYAFDALHFSVTDTEGVWHGNGVDPSQATVVTDYTGSTVASGESYLGEVITLNDGNGTVVHVYTVYIGGALVGAVTDSLIEPGVMWQVTGLTAVTTSNDPRYSDLYSQTYDPDVANNLSGGNYNDSIHAGAGNDTVWATNGDDSVSGGSGDDLIGGDAGNDTLDGGEGADTIWAGGGNDSVTGGDGNDLIGGDAGNDTIYGGAGNDTIWESTGDDYIDGGDGDDRIDGSSGADTIYGGLGNDSITGGDGNDLIYYGEGADSVDGGAGNDTIDDVAGINSYNYNNYLSGGDGNDEIYAGDGQDTVLGGNDNDSIYAEGGNDSIDGGSGNDSLSGGDGNDTIQGGDGVDTISGGTGNDSLSGGTGNDVFRVSAGDGQDTITDFDMGDADLDGFTNDQLDITGLLADDNQQAKIWDAVVSNDGSGNAVLTFPRGESVTLYGVSPAQADSMAELQSMGVPCYLSGTRIMTPSGEVPIETLRPGDIVSTFDRGPQPVLWAGVRHLGPEELMARPDLLPIRFRDGVLGNRGDLLVSPQHGMYLPGQDGATLARAVHLERSGDGRVRRARGRRHVSYHHLLLPQHCLIVANGAIGESLYPGRHALKGLDRAAKAELFDLFPGLQRIMATGPAERVYGATALPFVSGGVLARSGAPVLPSRTADRMPVRLAS